MQIRDELEDIIYGLLPKDSPIPFMLEYLSLNALERKIFDDFLRLMNDQ